MHASLAAPPVPGILAARLLAILRGAALTLIGVFAVRRELTEAAALDKILGIRQRVRRRIPRGFQRRALWTSQVHSGRVCPPGFRGTCSGPYFVGCALLAAALSIATKVQARLSATLLGVMIFFFVLSIHLPKVLANPHDRIAWAVLVRDSSFAGGAWALPDLTRKSGEITVPTS